MSLIPPFHGFLFRHGAPEAPFEPMDVLDRMGDGREIRRLFDALDDVLFFVRDVTGVYMAANTAFLRVIGLNQEEDLIGLSLHDVHSPGLAHDLEQEDQIVMRSGHASVERPEALFDCAGDPVCFCTTRLPLPDQAGQIIGVMAVSRRCDRLRQPDDFASEFDRISYEIRRAPGGDYRIAALAERCGLSPRRFNEGFRQVFGIPPQEFILRVRVEAAQESLRVTSLTMAQIADLHGFVDQAAFTRHFRRITGLTPGGYRKKAVSG